MPSTMIVPVTPAVSGIVMLVVENVLITQLLPFRIAGVVANAVGNVITVPASFIAFSAIITFL